MSTPVHVEEAGVLWFPLSFLHRDCVLLGKASAELSDVLAPSGAVVQRLLQYVWSLWEDPIDVSDGGSCGNMQVLGIHCAGH